MPRVKAKPLRTESLSFSLTTSFPLCKLKAAPTISLRFSFCAFVLVFLGEPSLPIACSLCRKASPIRCACETCRFETRSLQKERESASKLSTRKNVSKARRVSFRRRSAATAPRWQGDEACAIL